MSAGERILTDAGADMIKPRKFYSYDVSNLRSNAEAERARSNAMAKLFEYVEDAFNASGSDLSTNAIEQDLQELAHAFVSADDAAARYAERSPWAFADANLARNGLKGDGR